LSQFDVSQAYVLQRFQLAGNLGLAMFGEEFDGLVYRHVQYVEDALVLKLYVQYLLLEALAVARFTLQHEVGHELHLHGDGAFALTLFATSAF